jgi:hypothetical protein
MAGRQVDEADGCAEVFRLLDGDELGRVAADRVIGRAGAAFFARLGIGQRHHGDRRHHAGRQQL